MSILSPSKTEAPTIFQNRLDFIEALRGWAALYVVIFHLVRVPSPVLAVPFWASKIIALGGSGVTLFFIVSAFTLTFSMRLHEKEAHPTRRFYLRRIFRIVPLFYLWFIISWVRETFFLQKAVSWVMILLSVLFAFNLVPGYQQSIVLASWTIGVEMLFYLFFPLIYRFANNLQKACIFLFITLVASSIYSYLLRPYFHTAAQDPFFIPRSLLNQLPIFALGMVVFYIFEKFIQNKSISRNWAFLLIAVSAFGYSAFLDGRLKFFMEGIYWQAVIYSLLLLGLSISPIGLFVNRLSLFWGKLSYSLYLNHQTLVLLLIPVYRKIYALPLPLELKLAGCFLLVLTLLTAISFLTYHLIEKPGMQLGTKLIRKFASVPVASAAMDVPEQK